MNPYAVAYSIGYYYGRAIGSIPYPLPQADEYHSKNQGFLDGFAAGFRDFQDVDLPLAALAELVADSEKL